MTFDDVKTHFRGAAKLAKALGMERQSVYRWKVVGIPLLRQLEIEHMTEGALKADELPFKAAIRTQPTSGAEAE